MDERNVWLGSIGGWVHITRAPSAAVWAIMTRSVPSAVLWVNHDYLELRIPLYGDVKFARQLVSAQMWCRIPHFWHTVDLTHTNDNLPNPLAFNIYWPHNAKSLEQTLRQGGYMHTLVGNPLDHKADLIEYADQVAKCGDIVTPLTPHGYITIGGKAFWAMSLSGDHLMSGEVTVQRMGNSALLVTQTRQPPPLDADHIAPHAQPSPPRDSGHVAPRTPQPPSTNSIYFTTRTRQSPPIGGEFAGSGGKRIASRPPYGVMDIQGKRISALIGYLLIVPAFVGLFILFGWLTYYQTQQDHHILQEIQTIDHQHVQRIRLFEEKLTGYPGRKALLKEFNAQERQTFVAAFKGLTLHHPNHPAYSVKWDVEMVLTNGEIRRLRLLLDDKDLTFLHVENVGSKWYSSIAVMKSQALYQFMADYSKNAAEVIPSY